MMAWLLQSPNNQFLPLLQSLNPDFFILESDYLQEVRRYLQVWALLQLVIMILIWA
jgi:hypothetical protein